MGKPRQGPVGTLLSTAAPLLALLILLGVTTGCASRQITLAEGNAVVDRDLIYGVSLFGDSAKKRARRIVKPRSILAITPEMREFAKKVSRKTLRPQERARKLVRVMVRDDFFPKGYYTRHTWTARQVFEERSGNCLSYTNLYVTMARAMGLTAHFQLARTPTVWSAESGYVVRSRHINVLISDRKLPPEDWLTVDFNNVASSAVYPQVPVTDAYALSSFYNNLAINYLYEDDFEGTVAHLGKAIEIAPNNADSWVNLAAVYSQLDKVDETQAAFEAALRAEPGNESALAGLARLYTSKGESEKSKRYTDEIQSRRLKDPYFQFATAQASYDQGAYEQSLEHINRAIKIRGRGEFYYLRAQAHYARGDLSLASESLIKAQKRKRTLPKPKQELATLLASQIDALSESNNDLANDVLKEEPGE